MHTFKLRINCLQLGGQLVTLGSGFLIGNQAPLI